MPKRSNDTKITSDAASKPRTPKLADLLDEATSLIERYMTLPDPSSALLIGCWIANTYTYEHFKYCGYLALRSATPQCGKSRLLQLVGVLSKGAPKPIISPTPAVLFRRQQQVLLLDEVDRLGNRDKKMHGVVLAILNAGFQRGAIVERTEKTFHKKKEGFQLTSFPVYGPKALAGIESLADTLADRAFQIQMQRAVGRKERLNERLLEETFDRIRDDFEAWAETHANVIEGTYANLPASLSELADLDSRFQDISEPLVVLASLADEERPAGKLILPRLYAGLHFAAGRRQVHGREQSLIAFLEIAKDLLGHRERLFISSEDLFDKCKQHPDLGVP